MTLILYILYAITQKRRVTPIDFFEWMFYRLRTFWLIFFSFFVGTHLVIALSFDAFSEPQLVFLALTLCFSLALVNIALMKDKTIAAGKEKRVFVRPDSSCGIIYIMRRSDGILKFGKAQHLADRLRAHRKDYQADFDIVSSWVVPDVEYFEAMALSLTGRYFYREAQRRELRQMSEYELTRFILEFTNRVYRGWTQ